MTLVRFKDLGQYPILVIALSKCNIAFMSSCGNLRIMSVVIWSRPGALRGWRCLTTPCSSPVVNGRRVSEDGGRDVLLYLRYDLYTYIIIARISVTCSPTFPQFVFQVRHVHVRYHSSCFSYDTHTHTYGITARTTSPTGTVHLCFRSLRFRYGVYTKQLCLVYVRYTVMLP